MSLHWNKPGLIGFKWQNVYTTQNEEKRDILLLKWTISAMVVQIQIPFKFLSIILESLNWKGRRWKFTE